MEARKSFESLFSAIMSDDILIKSVISSVTKVYQLQRAGNDKEALERFKEDEQNIARGLAILIRRDDQKSLALIANAAVEGVLHTRLSSAHREALFRAALKSSENAGVRFQMRMVLGIALRQQGNTAEAEECVVRALAEAEKIPEADLPVRVMSMVGTATLGAPKDGERTIRELIPILEKVETIGKHHRTVLSLRSYLAELVQKQGRHDEAVLLYWDALENKRNTLGLNDKDTLITSNSLADCLLKLARYEEAETLIRSILPASKKIFGENHKTYLIHLETLAESLIGGQCFGEAKEILDRVLQKQTEVLGADHKQTRDTADLLVSLEDKLR